MDLPQIIIGCGKISRKIVGFYSKYTKENMCKKEMPKKKEKQKSETFPRAKNANAAKGQLISKAIYSVLDSSIKRTKKI